MCSSLSKKILLKKNSAYLWIYFYFYILTPKISIIIIVAQFFQRLSTLNRKSYNFDIIAKSICINYVPWISNIRSPNYYLSYNTVNLYSFFMRIVNDVVIVFVIQSISCWSCVVSVVMMSRKCLSQERKIQIILW